MGIFSSRVVFAMVWRPLALGSRSLVRARLRDLALRRTNLTFGRRVSSDFTHDSAFGGGAWEAGPFFASAFLSQAIHRFADPDRPGLISPRQIRRGGPSVLGTRSGGGFHDRSFDDNAGAGEFPQRHEQLAGERDDQPLACGPARHARQAPMKPLRQHRLRLMLQPQPRQLQHFRSQPRIARLRHALLVLDLSASPGRRREAGVSARLPAVRRRSGKVLRSRGKRRTPARRPSGS